MDTVLDIKIGLGLSGLLFGATMKDAENTFGIPEKTEYLEHELGDYPTTVMYYFDKAITLFFDDCNFKLFNCADIENTTSEIWGEKIFNMNEKQIIELFKSKGIIDYETEVHEWGEKRLSFDDFNIDFYFQNKKLKSINYGKLMHNSQLLILPN